METKVNVTRGIDFDDFVGSSYFEKSLKMSAPQLTPVFCKANSEHEDDFVGIVLSGYADSEQGLKQTSRMLFPTKLATDADIDELFDKVALEDGSVKLVAKPVALDEIFIRVSYRTPGCPDPENDSIKWVSYVKDGELCGLHGKKREYKQKNQ